MVEITQSLPRSTAYIWQMKENARTWRTILTAKTAGPTWVRRTLLKVQLSNAKIIHNTDPCYPVNDQNNIHVKHVMYKTNEHSMISIV